MERDLHLRAGILLAFFLCPAFSLQSVRADDPAQPTDDTPATAARPATDQPSDAQAASVVQLAEHARKSVVVITVTGRDGRQQGLGSGFIVSPDGLIATNLHVIGEARPISVQTADGKKYEVTEVHAFDRPLDLALIRVNAKDLPALSLGDSDSLKQGQAVVAIGNPHGFKHSVVAGVVSGTREIEGRQMIQLAIPIEPGNSGGPLLDMQGRVHGILTMKSAVTENLATEASLVSLDLTVVGILGELTLGIELERMCRGAETDHRLARLDIRDDRLHLVVGKVTPAREKDQ